MKIDHFWRKADDILTIYRSKHRRGILTDDEQLENVGDFLVDMDALASEWYNRTEKESINNDNETND